MNADPYSALFAKQLHSLLAELTADGRRHLAFIIVDDEPARETVLHLMRQRLIGVYELSEFCYTDSANVSLPHFCRALPQERPACVLVWGLYALKRQDQKRYRQALQLLNEYHELTAQTALVLCLTPEVYDDLRWWAQAFAEQNTAHVSLCNASALETLTQEIRRHKEQLSQLPPDDVQVAGLVAALDELRQRLTLLREHYDVMLCFVASDAEWAERLAARLRQVRVRVWTVPLTAQPDLPFKQWMNGEGPKCAKLLAVCSPEFCGDEALRAQLNAFLREQPEQLRVSRELLPLLRGECAWPTEWRALHPLDFHNEDDFELRFYQLLEALDLPAWGFNWANAKGPAPTNGARFVEAVASLYRALGFELEKELPATLTPAVSSTLPGARMDFLLRKNLAGFVTEALVKCFGHPPTATEWEQLLELLRTARQQYPRYKQLLVFAQPLAAEARSQLETEGVSCTTYADVLQELVPLEEYARKLLDREQRWRAEHWASEDRFIRPLLADESEEAVQPALARIADWLGDKRSNLLVMLGDLGTGKTTLAQFLAVELARLFLDDPLRHPAPVLVPLGDVRQEISLESVLHRHFQQLGLRTPSQAQFEFLARRGQIVLLLDAFDEMADRVRTSVMRSNFNSLLQPITQGWKVLLTCRTQYFRDHDAEIKLLGSVESAKESEGNLRQHLPPRLGTQVTYLQSFTDQQIQAYLGKARPVTAGEDWQAISAIYNLKELAQRPYLLELIVKSLPTLRSGERINAASLYNIYTDRWIEREERKGRLLDRQTKLGLMMELAWLLWSESRKAIHCDKFMRWLERSSGGVSLYSDEEDTWDIVRELEAASFLKRDRAGNFSFVHPSYGEYFLARKLYQALTDSDDALTKALAIPQRYDWRIAFFLTCLDEERHRYEPLRRILTVPYQPYVSENALQLLYWSARAACQMETEIRDFAALAEEMQRALPRGAQLVGANLQGCELSGLVLPEADWRAADLSGANLTRARLRDGNFREAHLHEASFAAADLHGSDFRGARRHETAVWHNASGEFLIDPLP